MNSKATPILPVSHQKKCIAIGKIKITLKEGGRGQRSQELFEYFLLCLIIHNCAIVCKPFGTPKFFHKLQTYLTQNGCTPTCKTSVYCGLEASSGNSLEW